MYHDAHRRGERGKRIMP